MPHLFPAPATLNTAQIGATLVVTDAGADSLLVACIALAALAIVLAGLLMARARRERRDLERLQWGAERFARGKLDRRISTIGSEAVARVAEAMNHMASQLDERFQAVVRQRNELEAVLSSMVEGVIAVDAEERVMTMNRAASKLLGIEPASAIDRSIQAVVRSSALHRLVSEALTAAGPVEGEVIVRRAEGAGEAREAERILLVTATVLHGAAEGRIGALLVLNDVTQLRRLETVRRDFVANVSHEMRTPITAVKGAVETLLDHSEHSPEDVQRLLEIIRRHADRMFAILEDLLTLARLDQQEGRAALEVEPGAVSSLINSAVEACQMLADARQTKIHTECEPELRVRMNRQLLEQALVNLIENAIKYSPPGSEVHVVGAAVDGGVAISVVDRGEGIEPQHLSRIFERFYRVDKGRSRQVGSTGLGLSIVRHICQAHGGRVEVQSAPGRGSTFQMFLPALGNGPQADEQQPLARS
ncbi:MAG: PAS domain-containing protein [Phycisphaerales bacterium]|nr:PAS domain-containing protein [Phycisphaerales bacterium]